MPRAALPAPDEAAWERDYQGLLVRVRGLVTALDRPPVVGLAGHGGAGKSTLAQRLAVDLGAAPEQVVGLDSCYAPAAHVPRGLFALHDWDVVTGVLAAARARPTPARLTFPTRWYDGTPGRRDVAMPPVEVVEGIRVLRPETRPLLDLAVGLDLWRTRWVPEALAYERAVDPRALADLVLPAPC